MNKRIIFIFSIFCCLCTAIVPCCAVDATPPEIPTEGDVWDGETITEPSRLVQKDGVYYYEITTCAQLAYVAQTGGDWLSKNYILANDLILNDVELTWDAEGNLLNDPETLNEWTPIGTKTSPYTGKFDGDQHTISGIYCHKATGPCGLFGYTQSESFVDCVICNSYILGREDTGGFIGCVDSYSASIEHCVFYGLVKSTGGLLADAGGICGGGGITIKSCVNYGTIVGRYYVGGISGRCSADSCINFGSVVGSDQFDGITGAGGDHVGGVTGSGGADNCVNYGVVMGRNYVGGISGNNGVYSSINYGSVIGNDKVGGIVGSGFVRGCANCGTVTGSEDVGGISGYSSSTISDCCNSATVTGVSNTGGIVGYGDKTIITNCYNIGLVLRSSGTDTTFGSIIGTDGALWGKDTITGCYYLKSYEVNPDLYGCGSITSSDISEPDGFYAKSAAELKQRSTFEGWDFTDTWSISPDLNSGYPYLAWQDVTDIPLTGLTLSRDTLSLSVGDGAYLTASQSPATAALPDLTWSSSEETVATVNANGRVAAVGAGDAEITVSGGGFSANCTVTVKARQQSEYRIGTLSLRDANGVEMTEIPTGSFLVTIPITKVLETGNATVALAVYAANGQYRGLLYVSVEDIPVGATVKITLPVDNTNGDIAQLKAFTFASFDMLIPLGEASVFPS